MGFLLMNENFEAIDIVEGYDSAIWTERYDKAGDFEFYFGLSSKTLSFYQEDFYIWCDTSTQQMIIEDVKVEKKEDLGSVILVTGRSLESILSRRIVWSQTTLKGNLQTELRRLINENIIQATDVSRRIPNLVFSMSTDPIITGLTIDMQLLGHEIYDVVSSACSLNDIGFRITLNDSNQFVFKLYSGIDRSYDQEVNPRMIFSPNFDNIGASNYLRSKKKFKTVYRVGGEGDDSDKKFVTVNRSSGSGSGLNRREGYTDSTASSENGAISDTDYTRLMQLDGARALGSSNLVSIFDGEILPNKTTEYNIDFGLGDIVQLEDSYIEEAKSKSRVMEFIRSESPNGNKAYPTLKSV